ncbi:MAG: MFS transporter [Proteobacteria bacterium]|nr:MFS transporter [Pseudomonadota bacterium]
MSGAPQANYLRRIYLRLAGVVMLAVVLALAANAVLSHRAFERALVPEMNKKVAIVGNSIRVLVLKAVENGIDFRDLYGVDEKFAEVDDDIPEVTYFSITDTEGKVLYQRPSTTAVIAQHLASPAVLAAMRAPEQVPLSVRVGSHYIVSLPIVGEGKPLGMLHLGVDVRFVDDVMLEMMYDLLVVLVVSLFFTLELLHFMAGARLEQALAALGDVFKRGAAGDFGTAGRPPKAELAFGSVIRLLESTLARVNAAYLALAGELEAARKRPAHERPPGLAAAQGRLQALGRRFRFGAGGADGARPADGSLAKVRAPLFIFILAEELTRSFLPGYVQELLVPIPGLSPQMVVGLPIALFMLIVAVGQPYFGVLSERWGTRRLMFCGAAVAAVGFVASALAASVIDLLAWRSLCALGYAMVFVAAQGYVLEHSTAENRAVNMATFVGAIMVATVCGPSIGGILADNLGERWTLALAALLAAASLLSIQQLPDRPAAGADGSAEARPPARVPKLSEVGRLLANRRFLTLTALAAMPAKILLTGLCFYLMPLYVTSAGGSQAMAGRVLMTYGVMVVLLSPLAARWASSRERMEWLVGGGLMLSGLGGLLLLIGPDIAFVFGAMVLIGAGQAMSISAQAALVSEHCGRSIAELGEGAVFGVYRLLERLGNAAGPLLGAALVMAYGYRTGFIALGGFVCCCGLLFVLATRRPPTPVPVPA